MQLMGIAEFIIGRAFARPVGSTPSSALYFNCTVALAVLLLAALKRHAVSTATSTRRPIAARPNNETFLL
jgi:hypothetical protein